MVLGARSYRFSPELTELLRDAYRAPNKRALSERLNVLMRLRPWPRQVWTAQAQRLGLSREARGRLWTAAEDRELLLGLGTLTVAALSRRLGRTRRAVEMRARKLEMSWRVRDGFDQRGLAMCFGVMPAKVAQWLEDGLLKRREGRISEVAVARFIRAHPDAYDLRRVDQVWFKSLLTVKANTGGMSVETGEGLPPII